MKPRSAIQKGKLLEDYVADQIVAKGIDPKARRDGGSGNGNREKGDIVTSMMILGQNAGIECKNQKSLAIPEWWRQTEKLQSLGREPVLVFRFHMEPMENTKAVIFLDTLLDLIKGQAPKGQNSTQNDESVKIDTRVRYKLENAVRANKEAIKALEDITN